MGESAAVMNMVDTLTGCLARGGCAVVPGLSADHYYFTLAVSIAGGVIAGAASKLEPSGEGGVRWVGIRFRDRCPASRAVGQISLRCCWNLLDEQQLAGGVQPGIPDRVCPQVQLCTPLVPRRLCAAPLGVGRALCTAVGLAGEWTPGRF